MPDKLLTHLEMKARAKGEGQLRWILRERAKKLKETGSPMVENLDGVLAWLQSNGEMGRLVEHLLISVLETGVLRERDNKKYRGINNKLHALLRQHGIKTDIQELSRGDDK